MVPSSSIRPPVVETPEWDLPLGKGLFTMGFRSLKKWQSRHWTRNRKIRSTEWPYPIQVCHLGSLPLHMVTMSMDHKNQWLFSSTKDLLTLGFLSVFLADVKIFGAFVLKSTLYQVGFQKCESPNCQRKLILMFNYNNSETESPF